MALRQYIKLVSDAGDTGVAAVAVGILDAQLVKGLLCNVFTGDEGQCLTVCSQILFLAKAYHFLGHGSDLFCAGDGSLHATLIEQVGDLLGFGVVQIGLSLKSHDPSQRANGFLTLAGGVVITFAKEILTLITG